MQQRDMTELNAKRWLGIKVLMWIRCDVKRESKIKGKGIKIRKWSKEFQGEVKAKSAWKSIHVL